MNLMFWKKKPLNEEATDNPQEAEDDRTVAMEVPDLDTPARPGLIPRLKSGFSGLLLRFRKSPAPDPENAEESQAPESTEAQIEDAPNIRSLRTKKRLILGGAIGLLFLLLAGAGFAAWKLLLSSPEQDSAAPAMAEAAHGSPPEEPGEIEALRKKNDELQAQIEALKKQPQQDQPPASAENGAGGEADTSSEAGEMTLSNKDPKAAAQSLKEAIEAMNAGSGTPARKTTK